MTKTVVQLLLVLRLHVLILLYKFVLYKLGLRPGGCCCHDNCLLQVSPQAAGCQHTHGGGLLPRSLLRQYIMLQYSLVLCLIIIPLLRVLHIGCIQPCLRVVSTIITLLLPLCRRDFHKDLSE